jgi:hypothetical protein
MRLIPRLSRTSASVPGLLIPVVAATILSTMLAGPLAAQGGRLSIRDRAAQEEQDRKEKAANSRYSVIDGVVTDTLLRPMAVATVSVVGIGARVTTGDNGRFRFLQVPPGQYLLVVRRIGFAPTSGIVAVPVGDTLRLSYLLARSTNVMDTVRITERRVSLRMMEFESRRMQGQGQFITQEQIEKRNSLASMDYLRQLRGIDVSRITSGAFAGTVALSKREGGSLAGTTTGACPMQILLDGIVLPANFNLELLPSPKQLSGIEVYSGAATIPAQFGGGDRRCGLIAFWTRDGY